MRFTPRLQAALIMAVPLLLAATGCDLGTFEQDFDTDLQVYDPGPFVDFLEVEKGFRFSGDLADADEVTILSASVEVLDPSGSDFGFLDSLEVYVVLGDQELLVASTGIFNPRDSRIALKVEYDGDLREWTADQRVSLRFVAYPEKTFAGWPDGGFTVRAVVTLEVVAF